MLVENRDFCPSGSCQNIALTFAMKKKTKMVGLPDGEKKFENNTFIRFDTTHERDGQTDGQISQSRSKN